MTKGRMWIGTLNNPKVDTAEFIEAWSKQPGVCYVTGQLEKGSEGTPHIQYYLHLKENARISALKKHCQKSHFEVVKKNNGADTYCNKEDTRLEGPFTHGIRPARRDAKGEVARRNRDIISKGVAKALEDGDIRIEEYCKVQKCINAYKTDTRVGERLPGTCGIWIYGPPGSGKTHKVHEEYDDLYLKQQNKWWDGYNGQKNVLLDDHDTDTLSHFMKIWTDKYPKDGEIKGSNTQLIYQKFIVTSNYTIDKLYKDKGEELIEALKRRFEVIHMPKLGQ